jgi:hypothetical protein
MAFSIDTNLIVGVVNSKDRLHEQSIMLMKDKSNDKLFISLTALVESQNIFSNKTNKIVVEIIEYLPGLQSKASHIERNAEILQIFANLKLKYPSYSNFLELVYDNICAFLHDHDIDKLPSFLTPLSLNISSSLYPELEKYHLVEEVISINKSNLSLAKKSAVDVYFKDSNDERIYLDLITNLTKIKPATFYSNDKEFIKKMQECYVIFSQISGHEKEAFSCHLC